MVPKRFYSQNFSLLIVKFKKLGFSNPLIYFPSLIYYYPIDYCILVIQHWLLSSVQLILLTISKRSSNTVFMA